MPYNWKTKNYLKKKTMDQIRVAIVTGSNKGIGLEIVKGLCKKFDGIVYLTGFFKKP